MLERLDQQLFLFINSHNSPFFDQVMYVISGRVTWIPLYLAILIALGIKYKRKFYFIILMIIVAMTLSDQLALLIKNEVQRLRPCHLPALEGLVHIVRGICGGAYGFVSSHASNSFTIALFTSMLINRKWFSWSMVFWALLVGYSRIYLGVHYPGDVLCGSILGIIVGWSVAMLFRLSEEKLLPGWKFFNGVK
jgi:undecaprenyl-diphosphatase